MLKNIDPLLTPDLLKLLAEMGHEDAIVLADANFTAMRYRISTVSQQVIHLPEVGIARVAQAVLSVLPLGLPDEQPIAFMHASGQPPAYVTPAQQAVIAMVQADPAHAGVVACPMERFAFYEQAKVAYVIVQTGEMSPFGNFIFKKGVIAHRLA